MSNTITAYFKGRVGVAESVYQYDYGKILIIDGLNLPATFEVHFTTISEEDAVTVIGRNNRVAIPDSCINKTGVVTAFIYLHAGDNDGETEYEVKFNVIRRVKPDYDEDEKRTWETAASLALAMLQNSRKVNNPTDDQNQVTYGTAGQLLRTKGDGSTEWVDEGLPTDEQTAAAVSAWLDDHPEATTSVEDGSLTESKFTNALKLKTIKDYVTPQMFGAVGDGVADDTDAIQQALDSSYVVVFPKGTYRITMDQGRYHPHNNHNVCFGVKIQNNALYFDDCVFTMDGHDDSYYYMFFLYDAQNTLLEGKATFIGDRLTNTSGESRGEGHIIAVMHGDNITIRDITIKDAWGDGIWLMNDGYDSQSQMTAFPKNVTIENVLCDYNRRNGLSICCGENIYVSNCEFNNCKGTDPRAGIDIEANGDGYSLKNIHICNVRSYGCDYGGFGTVMKTDGDSVFWDKVVSDGGFYLRIESGCDKGLFVASDIVCGDVVELQDNLTLLNMGTDCSISVDNVKCKPSYKRACLSLANREGAGKMYISNINADMSNAQNDEHTRCCPIFLNDSQALHDVTIVDFNVYGGGYHKPFVSAAGLSDSAAYSCDFEINIFDSVFGYTDHYWGFFHNEANANNRLKYYNNVSKLIDMEHVRGNYSMYKVDGSIETVYLRYLPTGTRYVIVNVSEETDVNINMQPPQVQILGGTLANYFTIPAGHSAEVWYNESAEIYNGIVY